MRDCSDSTAPTELKYFRQKLIEGFWLIQYHNYQVNACENNRAEESLHLEVAVLH